MPNMLGVLQASPGRRGTAAYPLPPVLARTTAPALLLRRPRRPGCLARYQCASTHRGARALNGLTCGSRWRGAGWLYSQTGGARGRGRTARAPRLWSAQSTRSSVSSMVRSPLYSDRITACIPLYIVSTSAGAVSWALLCCVCFARHAKKCLGNLR